MPTKHIISPQKNLPNNAKVCALIDEESHNSIKDKVMQEFLPHQAQIILGIPLSYHRTNDTLIWVGTKSRNYMTKSACKMLSNCPNPTLLGVSDPSA